MVLLNKLSWFKLGMIFLILFGTIIIGLLPFHFFSNYYYYNKWEKDELPTIETIAMREAVAGFLFSSGRGFPRFDRDITCFARDEGGNIIMYKVTYKYNPIGHDGALILRRTSQRTGKLKWRFFHWGIIRGGKTEFLPPKDKTILYSYKMHVALSSPLLRIPFLFVTKEKAPLICFSFTDPPPFMLITLFFIFAMIFFVIGIVTKKRQNYCNSNSV